MLDDNGMQKARVFKNPGILSLGHADSKARWEWVEALQLIKVLDEICIF